MGLSHSGQDSEEKYNFTIQTITMKCIRRTLHSKAQQAATLLSMKHTYLAHEHFEKMNTKTIFYISQSTFLSKAHVDIQYFIPLLLHCFTSEHQQLSSRSCNTSNLSIQDSRESNKKQVTTVSLLSVHLSLPLHLLLPLLWKPTWYF